MIWWQHNTALPQELTATAGGKGQLPNRWCFCVCAFNRFLVMVLLSAGKFYFINVVCRLSCPFCSPAVPFASLWSQEPWQSFSQLLRSKSWSLWKSKIKVSWLQKGRVLAQPLSNASPTLMGVCGSLLGWGSSVAGCVKGERASEGQRRGWAH